MKKLDFFTKVRLCLCLIIGFCWWGCSVFRSENGTVNNFRYYQITILSEPTFDFSALIAMNAQSVSPPVNVSFWGRPEMESFTIRVHDELTLNTILVQLQTKGVIIKNVQLEN